MSFVHFQSETYRMQRKPLDAEMELFRDSARKFFQTEIRQHSERWREAGIVDREAFLKAGQAGYLCVWADERYGGLGLKDFRYEQILIEENVLHGDPGFFMTVHSRLIAPYIGSFGTEEQKQRYFPGIISGNTILAVAMTEPDAGSDIAATKTRAEDKGDHWLLNGSKTYISNGILADLVIVAAKTHPENPHAMTLFLVERGMEGFERGRNLKKMGLKSQDTAELFFRDVKVPKTNVLGQVNKGFYHLMHALAEERLLSATGNVVAARAAVDVTREFVRNRKVFGKPLSKMQNTRFKLAALDTEIEVAQTFIDRCIEVHNEGRLSPEDAARAKLFASEVYGRAVDEGVQLHGGAGYMDEYPICRMYQDERINRIFAGTSEIMKEIIARSILD
ncbi:acyl-CoA dehydrogenase family protein [Solimonas sp. SE-A11]|nr:acyl-CoA dehydrogenase family protein [Solimonas sp. SE-A11]MDM4769798.1 acyl-CoA dehydrogenase family protein [Solimonas sp. SE-A11]